MAKIKITIDTGNAAFDNPRELSRILEDLAYKFKGIAYEMKVTDINGNIVGEVEVEE